MHRLNICILSFVLLLQVSEMENDISPVQEDEGPNAVSQLAKKVCGLNFGLFLTIRKYFRMWVLYKKEYNNKC